MLPPGYRRPKRSQSNYYYRRLILGHKPDERVPARRSKPVRNHRTQMNPALLALVLLASATLLFICTVLCLVAINAIGK